MTELQPLWKTPTRALVVAGPRPQPDEPAFTDVDAINAHHLARTRAMSLDSSPSS